MLRRLFKHEQEGLINSATCPTVSDAIYFLTKKAAPIVAAKYGMDLSEIWVHFNEYTLEHDLLASGCAKKIIREADEKKLFDLSYLILECSLKKDKLKKGGYYPDVLFGIKGAERDNMFNLEIDCGTISRKDFIGKISYFQDSVLVVTKTWKRLELLLWYLQVEQVSRPVYLTQFKNFLSKDLLTCMWHSNISKKTVSIEIS
jgi:hypothetical protein